jgi:hypothetical protein
MPPTWFLLPLLCVNTISVTGYSSFFPHRDGTFSSPQAGTLPCTRRLCAADPAGSSLTTILGWHTNMVKIDRTGFLDHRMFKLRHQHRASSSPNQRLLCMLLQSERTMTSSTPQKGWMNIFRAKNNIRTKSDASHAHLFNNFFTAKRDGARGLHMCVLAEEENTDLGRKSAVESS